MGCEQSKNQGNQSTDAIRLPFKRNGYFKQGATEISQAIKYFQGFLQKDEFHFQGEEQKLVPDSEYEWGNVPLENQITQQPDISSFKKNQPLYNQGLHIVEPWENVGHNFKNEPVRASKNLSYVVQMIADVDSTCYPLWKTGKDIPVQDVIESLEGGVACLFEGGNPDPYDENTFTHQICPRSYLFDVYKQVVLNWSKMRRCIFICLSHQLLITALVELIKDFVQQVQSEQQLEGLTIDIQNILIELAKKVDQTGNQIYIRKFGKPVLKGYKNEKFATWKNEKTEAEQLKLYAFEIPEPSQEDDWLNQEIIQSYTLHSKKNIGVIEKMLEETENIKITMFHSSEVNQESVIFASWVFQEIRKTVLPIKKQIQESKNFQWLVNLPIGLEIIGSTKDQQGNVVTEAACYRVDFQEIDENLDDIHHFYSTQFHPELFADLSDISTGKKQDYKSLQAESGVNMLVRMLISNR